MESRLDKVSRLKNRVEELQSDLHKAEGALNQVIEQIRTEFLCLGKDSGIVLEKAEKRLAQLRKEDEAREVEIDRITAEIEKELSEHE